MFKTHICAQSQNLYRLLVSAPDKGVIVNPPNLHFAASLEVAGLVLLTILMANNGFPQININHTYGFTTESPVKNCRDCSL